MYLCTHTHACNYTRAHTYTYYAHTHTCIHEFISSLIHSPESLLDSMSVTIIEKYKDRFLSYIDACAIVTRLEIEEVIPDTVSHKIQQSAPSVANEVLFLHLRSHSSLETLHKLCDVMIGMSGYPKMNKLGRLMKEDLTTVSCVAESSKHTSHVQCHFVQCVVYMCIHLCTA